MGKTRDFRGPRRRGFDDDAFEPRDTPDFRPARPFPGFAQDAAPEGPPVKATVKWFNPEKGFGFAALADGTGDAFLHIRVLQAAGRETVPPGATLSVNVGQGQKGRQITRVIEVDESTAEKAPARRAAPGQPRPRREDLDTSSAVDATGTVKWFNGDKGFGFVATGDGGRDVFVHISVLGRSGVASLAEGQQVSMRVVETPKGREAVSISLAG